MATSKIQAGLWINEVLYAKSRYLSDKEQCSRNNMIEYGPQYAERYETENGEICVNAESIYR